MISRSTFSALTGIDLQKYRPFVIHSGQELEDELNYSSFTYHINVVFVSSSIWTDFNLAETGFEKKHNSIFLESNEITTLYKIPERDVHESIVLAHLFSIKPSTIDSFVHAANNLSLHAQLTGDKPDEKLMQSIKEFSDARDKMLGLTDGKMLKNDNSATVNSNATHQIKS